MKSEKLVWQEFGTGYKPEDVKVFSPTWWQVVGSKAMFCHSWYYLNDEEEAERYHKIAKYCRKRSKI